MEKYRVRLKTGRVVGPFLENQILEMRDKQIISGQEDCQVYPTGDWLPVKEFSFWQSGSQKNNKEATFVIDLTQLQNAPVKPVEQQPKGSEKHPEKTESVVSDAPPENPKYNKTQFREFDYKNAIDEVDEMPEPPKPVKNVAPAPVKAAEKSEKTVIKVMPKEDENEKTVVRSITAPKNNEEFDKTTVRTEAIKWKNEQEIERQKKEVLQQKIDQENKIREEEEKKNKFNLDTDSTQAISLSSLKNKLHEEAVRSEHELVQIEEIVQSNKRKQQEKKENEELKEEEEDNQAEEAEKKK
jgi:hypothetical protein